MWHWPKHQLERKKEGPKKERERERAAPKF